MYKYDEMFKVLGSFYQYKTWVKIIAEYLIYTFTRETIARFSVNIESMTDY